MVEFKIDIDNHKFSNYLKIFGFRYRMLRYAGVRLYSVHVFRTKHGFHIYLYTKKIYSFETILLIECFLNSDVNKQLYAFIEGKDILFREKHRKNYTSREKYDVEKTKKLLNLIQKINKEQRKQKIIEVSLR